MDIRDLMVDGITQLHDWLNDAMHPLTPEQVNWLPPGSTVSAGFNAWHISRTADNIAHFVMRRQQPIWVDKGYFEKLGLPKVDQGTGMGLEDARNLTIIDTKALNEYIDAVFPAAIAILKDTSVETLMEPQMIRPLGEMPKWRVYRQVIMTHGFMHLGEINAIRGQLGLSFSI